jgi:hypothetical protein
MTEQIEIKAIRAIGIRGGRELRAAIYALEAKTAVA